MICAVYKLENYGEGGMYELKALRERLCIFEKASTSGEGGINDYVIVRLHCMVLEKGRSSKFSRYSINFFIYDNVCKQIMQQLCALHRYVV